MIKYLFSCFFFLIAFSAIAENSQLLENVPPPPSSIDSNYIGEPEVTIKKKGAQTQEEYRVNGQLYMIKVNPDNMPSYYLYKNSSGGDWIRFDEINPKIIPQWVILRF
jgi:hypothetical protein|tara:strand:- start:189 stop:512 length:324 start_codon:yes stop_codon:yes gene_type:complete